MYRLLTRTSLSKTIISSSWRWQMKRKLSSASTNLMTTLHLDRRERQLKGLLLDAAAYIDNAEGKEQEQKVELRWAGGWVRDKLLGLPSHDIDVAINCMTGEDFGNRLRDFCDVAENMEKHSLRNEDIGNLHKIEKNPDKSKNLETATVRIFGLDVDFVNLRTETYVEDSRNPQMEFGTAEEDARRRDATVNALFYNIHTDEVEDFVGGLKDMQARVIRTPMEPFQTFMDDPLRVLRLVRFSSRLGFAIEPSAKDCMGNESVLKALRVKISRERVGIEVEKMLRGKHPRDAVRYIEDLGLYHTVFTDPARPDMHQPDLTGWRTAYEFLDTLATYPFYEKLVTSDEERYFAWVLACVVPFTRAPGQDLSGNLKKTPPPATLAAREGIKAPNKLSELITAAVRHREEIVGLRDMVCSGDERMSERDLFGMAIRRWEAQGKHWRLQVLFAMLDDVMVRAQSTHKEGHASSGSDAAEYDTVADAWAAASDALDRLQGRWLALIGHLEKLDLMDAASLKPLIDGRKLSQALGIKPDRWMTPAMGVCMAWQLRNPGETDPAGAVEEVRRRKEELGIAQLLEGQK